MHHAHPASWARRSRTGIRQPGATFATRRSELNLRLLAPTATDQDASDGLGDSTARAGRTDPYTQTPSELFRLPGARPRPDGMEEVGGVPRRATDTHGHRSDVMLCH